jgi:hypothetical protein
MEKWKAVLVDAPMQSGKTRRTFEIMSDKLSNTENTIILFITQANSVCSANQVLQRAKKQLPTSVVKTEHIYKSNNLPSKQNRENIMIVDFWNSRNTTIILDFIHVSAYSQVVVIFDEVDQGGYNGVKERLTFVWKVERRIPSTKLIFITATVGNLSKSICQIAEDNSAKFQNSAVIRDIIYNPVVEHQYVQPFDNYVGPSWFKETAGVWKPMKFDKKKSGQTKESYNCYKEEVILHSLEDLPEDKKKLTLISVTSRIQNHESMVDDLFAIGYNATVELNGRNLKNYRVQYVNHSGHVKTWNIPYKEVDGKADSGGLKMFRYKRKMVDSFIEKKEDYTLPHMLQASLFMNTDYEDSIKGNIEETEYIKLKTLSNALDNMKSHETRPIDYPDKPIVALIAGNLASRGITFQDPMIGFVCTAFCFTDTNDKSQRAAINSQRFGRACGMLSNVYSSDTGSKPVLLATENILCGAISNELILREKAALIENGKLFSLKDMITQSEWKQVVDRATKQISIPTLDADETVVDGIAILKLIKYMSDDNLLVSKMIRCLYESTKDGTFITFDELKAGISYDKSMKELTYNIFSGRSKKSQYGKLWHVSRKTNIQVNNNIIKYIDKYYIDYETSNQVAG